MATRQNSANGKPKSPRVQVVLPEDLCKSLSALAKRESRTVSNMAKVLIQKGVTEFNKATSLSENKVERAITSTEGFRSALEAQESKRIKVAPRKIRLHRS